VTKRRLRDGTSVDYQVIRDNFVWADHVLRLLATAGAVAWLKPSTVLDPACGDASIVEHAHALYPIEHAYLYDISRPQIANLKPTMSHTKGALDIFELQWPTVDVVILTEILEHVEEPELLVRRARDAGKYLVASSPIDESVDVNNHEHLWAWGVYGYRDMLVAEGWKPKAYTEVAFPHSGYPYTYQIWICE
jgi:2-polyprenyl-3-methyl-5-hydroxy-6-metoxy-1,4-benzoquinol methylase